MKVKKPWRYFAIELTIVMLIAVAIQLPSEQLSQPQFSINDSTVTLLNIPTYDGSNQVVHPDVIHFSSRWNNYTYWMAYTPFPNTNYNYENPSIVASNDGIIWTVPNGLHNPIASPTVKDRFLPDPELTWNGTALRAYWKGSDGVTRLYSTGSTDGIHWDQPTVSFFTGGYGYLSPTVIRDGLKWKMWAVNMNPSPNRMDYFESPDGSSWKYVRECTGTVSDDKEPWHITVQKVGNTYWGLLVECKQGTNGIAANIYFISSANGINWVSYGQPVLSTPLFGWDNGRIYRSAFTVEHGNLKVWFSGCNVADEWRIGYAEKDVSDIFGDVSSDNFNVRP